MAAPSTPTNLVINQGDSRNYLSWDLTATATSYSVERSTDGVSYSVIASPTVPYYSDTTATINTLYYYKVAATNGDGTSSYSSAVQMVACLPGKRSLYELRLMSQQRADRVNSNFVIKSEWNSYINQAYYELYDLLITTNEDYYVAPRATFITDGNSSYALPTGAADSYSGAPAFYKMYGVDLGLDSSQDAWVTLKKYNFISRNRFVFPQITTSLLGIFNMQYRVYGNSINFIPTAVSGQTIGLWYFPRLTTLLADTDVIDGISGWEEYVIVRAAKYALDKEESDTSKLDAQLLFLKDRIESTAMNRDAGQPDTISNVRTQAERWGGPPNGDGSYGGWAALFIPGVFTHNAGNHLLGHSVSIGNSLLGNVAAGIFLAYLLYLFFSQLGRRISLSGHGGRWMISHKVFECLRFIKQSITRGVTHVLRMCA